MWPPSCLPADAPELVGSSGSLAPSGMTRGLRLGAGRCVETGWWTGRAGGRDDDGRSEGRCAGCRGRSARTTSASASAPGRARRGAPVAAGAGRWMRSSRAPGPARSGCGTRRAASGWCAAPTLPIRRRRGWWRSRRTSEDRAGRDLGASWPSRCDGGCPGALWSGAATGSTGHVEYGENGALGLVPVQDHLRRQRLHPPVVARQVGGRLLRQRDRAVLTSHAPGAAAVSR
jgi:hypothetical protein